MFIDLDNQTFRLDKEDRRAFDTSIEVFPFDDISRFFDVLASARARLRREGMVSPTIGLEELYRTEALQDFAADAVAHRAAPALIAEVEVHLAFRG